MAAAPPPHSAGAPHAPAPDIWQDTHRARSFDRATDQYDQARPGYPAALFDTVEELAGRPLGGADTVDVGAGTGIATRSLLARGARVVAVEPGAGMADRLRRTLPAVPLLRADGDALPLADASADLITYAQSWHWTDPERSLPEALRVLRPGGALAVWWNAADHSVPWIAGQSERLCAVFGDDAPGRARELPDTVPAVKRSIRWTRRVPLATHLDNIGSHSNFLTADPRTAADTLRRERDELLMVFPDGQVVEEYTVLLTVTRRPPATTGDPRTPAKR